ncbi:MAG: OsmC family protein [Bacteroidales bacterium]
MGEKIICDWKDDMAFETEVNGFKITLDADKKVGGKDRGPRPKPLLLVSLAGCTSMDVKSILTKMRVFPDSFRTEAEGEMTEEHPRHFHKIHLRYIFKGKALPEDKIEKAVSLSQNKYCGVTTMLEKAAEITHEIIIE